jgi:hypothetical protein
MNGIGRCLESVHSQNAQYRSESYCPEVLVARRLALGDAVKRQRDGKLKPPGGAHAMDASPLDAQHGWDLFHVA